MLQPKRREQLDANIKELLNNGGSNADVEKMAQDFVAKFGNEQVVVEKKNPNGTATTQKKSGESVQTIGSSGFPKFDINDYTSKKSVVKKEQNFIEKDNTSIAPISKREVSIEQIRKDNKIAKPFIDKQKKLAKEKLSNFRNDTALPNDYEAQARQEVSDEVAEKGILNTVKSGLTDWWNNTFDDEGLQINKDVLASEKEDGKAYLLHNGYKPEDITPELLQKTAFDLKVARKVDDKKLSLQ